MKKLPIDYAYLKIAIYVLIVACCAIVFEKTIGNISELTSNIQGFLGATQSVFASFIYGVFIAYFLNPVVRVIEMKALIHINPLQKRCRLRRLLAIFITYIILIGFLVWTISYLIPEIYANIRNLITSVQRIDFAAEDYDNNVISQFLNSVNQTFGTGYSLREIINSILAPIVTSIMDLPRFLNMIWASTTFMASGMLKFIIGLIISFYMLLDKEVIGGAAKRFLQTILKSKNADKVVHVFNSGNVVFQSFITGKAIDSLIVGIIFFLTCLFLKPPFALLLSVVIGVTNMIPYFGPFIGAVPVILIVLLYNPILALWVALDILIIQQFDGYVLGPKILGDSTGLKPLGVIFAITAGGAAFGIFGMFIGVPLFAVVKKMCNGVLERVYERKYSVTEEPESQENSEIQD